MANSLNQDACSGNTQTEKNKNGGIVPPFLIIYRIILIETLFS